MENRSLEAPKKKSRWMKVVSNLPEAALLVILVPTLVDMFLGAVSRYVVGKAIYWAEELGTFGLVWLTMIGAAVALKRNAHFVMPTFLGRFSPRVQSGIALFNLFLIMLFGFLMIFAGIETTLSSWETPSPALEVNLGIINLAGIVGGLLILIYAGLQGKAILTSGPSASPKTH